MSKKIISFGLYGYNKFYQLGAMENLALQPAVYPGWKCRFYVSHEIPEEVVAQLIEGGAEVIVKQREHGDDGMFWRFLPASDESVEVLIVRDADSRLNMREKHAVDEWLQSGKPFHIMRDHPHHITLIMGGMWGCRKNTIPQMAELIHEWQNFDGKQRDQEFLAQKVYPLIEDKCFIHSEVIKYAGETVHPFPTKRVGREFVGEPFSNDASHAPLDLSKLRLRTLRRPGYSRKQKPFWRIARWL
jgi:hypothetical protein